MKTRRINLWLAVGNIAFVAYQLAEGTGWASLLLVNVVCGAINIKGYFWPLVFSTGVLRDGVLRIEYREDAPTVTFGHRY